MKRTLTLLAAALFAVGVFSQAPEKMSYQAVIRNTSGALVKSSPVGIKISILQSSFNGMVVYAETHTDTTSMDGLVILEIGGGTILSGDFKNIDWSTGPYFLKTETDPSGGTNYTITGTSQLLSVSYALYAKTSGNGLISNYNNLTNKPALADSISKYSVLLTGNQTIAGNKTFTGTLTGTVNANNTVISNVAIPINSNDAANKAYIDTLIKQLYAQGALRVRDFDGNYYNTLKIGTQIWMVENLKTKHYNNGDSIGTTYPYNKNITSETSPKYQWAYNGDENNVSVYGRLYTWYAITDSRNVCPTGWHIPSDADWTILYQGGEANMGGKLKEIGTSHWNSPNTGATNETGFTALPGGRRYGDGGFYNIGYDGFWWNPAEAQIPENSGWSWDLFYDDNNISREDYNKELGLSVRCIKE